MDINQRQTWLDENETVKQFGYSEIGLPTEPLECYFKFTEKTSTYRPIPQINNCFCPLPREEDMQSEVYDVNYRIFHPSFIKGARNYMNNPENLRLGDYPHFAVRSETNGEYILLNHHGEPLRGAYNFWSNFTFQTRLLLKAENRITSHCTMECNESLWTVGNPSYEIIKWDARDKFKPAFLDLYNVSPSLLTP
jgi:hypothetical protein